MESSSDESSRRKHLRIGRVVKEGIVGGAIGALAAVLPHFGLDLVSGEPLRTPTALYALVLGSRHAAAHEAAQTLQFTALHLALWIGVGLLAAYLVGLADVRPRAWSAIFSLIACVFATVLYVAGVLSRPEETGLPLWVGTLTGSVALAWVLAARHAGLLRQFDRVSLTATARHDLDVAYDRECRSRALYRAVVRQWPDDGTLDELLAVSERRVEILAALFAHYALHPPKDRDDPPAHLPASLAETYRAAVNEETEKVAMYDGFLLSIDESKVRATFGRLRWESRDECLPRLHAGATSAPRATDAARSPGDPPE